MKSWHICALVLIIGVCYMSDVQHKLISYKRQSEPNNRIWSALVKPIMLALSVSWLCWNLVFWDSMTPGLDPKPVNPTSIFERQDLPPYSASLNYYVALSLGPLVALACFW
uniref:Uncharacterized protein n=1 Tax=Cacopsylla melanoneura TaxID=428564 RepID=A0A8D8XRG6_9HEMI